MKHYWRKLGLLYSPSGDRHPDLLTHAANPLAVPLDNDVYRIFYSGRDARKRSSVGAVDVDLLRMEVVQDHREPFFTLGPPGSYFADGISVGNCYHVDGHSYMLFMGWQVEGQPHWRGDIGRLLLSDALALLPDQSISAPMLSIDSVDPISLSYPWVMPHPAGGFDMWYGSTLSWDAGNGDMLHVIHHAYSDDGWHWQRHGLAVPYEVGVAQAFSRPTVSRNSSGHYEMWFSYRSGAGETYRIGYATSPAPAGPWTLALQDTGLDVSADGWDSEMIEYPYVFSHKGREYMLYNGNGFGRSGFGLAVREAV